MACRILKCSGWFFAFVFLIGLPLRLAAQPLDGLLSTDNLWSLTQDQFQDATKTLPFQWTSNARDSARAANMEMTLFGLPVVEFVARFDGQRLKELTAMFYARGDAGNITKEKFGTLVKASADAVDKFTQVKFTARGKDPTNAVKADGIQWQTDKARFLLEYSFTKEIKTRDVDFRAEFVRLEITSPERKASLLASATNPVRAKFTGAQHVKRDLKSGDVFIHDVPMVDQGQKGYCVVASTERVMRYYGTAVDANELAQIANSDADGGTSLTAMIASLKKIAARLRVRVRAIEEQDVKGIMELIKDYNRAAKRAKAPELPDPGRSINVASIFEAMDYSVLKEARTHNKSDMSRFQRSVQSHVDQGTPLLWCVQLGLFKEPDLPQGGGGHMRLLIGYNNTTQELLYTDSWGAGHELKRMAAPDAWSITTALTSVEPL